MPRRARIILADQPVHVVHRGNNRAACFVSDEDRSFYLFHLGRMLPRFQCALHAYCLMTNHVHLLLTPFRSDSCALLMKHLAQLHTQYVNRVYRRTGGLWEGRFRSCLVQSETYLLNCYRYVELNPVRGGLVSQARDYLWSSYRANADGSPSAMLSPHAEYLRLGMSDAERQKAYRDLFGVPLQDKQLSEIRAATNGGYALGDARFRAAMKKRLGRRVERGSAGRPIKEASGSGELPFSGGENSDDQK